MPVLMKPSSHSALLLLLVLASIFAFADRARAADNILLLIADDLGADSCPLTGATGASLPPMPNITALKNSGVLFRNAWSHPTCSPMRASLLTGRHPFRTGIGTALMNATSPQLQTAEFTLPEAFAANTTLGYQLASFGKWHLTAGPGTQSNPNTVGSWPHFAGLLSGALPDYYNWTKTTNGVNSTVTTYATTETANDVIAWISAQGTSPWFAWVAFNAPHAPFHIPPTSLHSYGGGPLTNRQRFEAAFQAMDTEIGRILASVDLSKTNIVFIGDNGTPPQIIQTPYTSAHAKESLYEGGTKVPLLISGPAVVSPNRESTALVHAVDLYATILELAGIDVSSTQPAANPIDSHRLLPILNATADTSRFAFSEQFGGTLTAAESGHALRDSLGYKLIQFDDNREELYKIDTDLNEATNLLSGTLSTGAQASYDSLRLEMSNYQTILATPTIQSTTRSGSEFTIRVQRTTGLTYSLYRSTVLAYGTWSLVSGATIVDEGNTLTLTDPTASGSAFFYCVLAVGGISASTLRGGGEV